MTFSKKNYINWAKNHEKENDYINIRNFLDKYSFFSTHSNNLKNILQICIMFSNQPKTLEI